MIPAASILDSFSRQFHTANTVFMDGQKAGLAEPVFRTAFARSGATSYDLGCASCSSQAAFLIPIPAAPAMVPQPVPVGVFLISCAWVAQPDPMA